MAEVVWVVQEAFVSMVGEVYVWIAVDWPSLWDGLRRLIWLYMTKINVTN